MWDWDSIHNITPLTRLKHQVQPINLVHPPDVDGLTTKKFRRRRRDQKSSLHKVVRRDPKSLWWIRERDPTHRVGKGWAKKWPFVIVYDVVWSDGVLDRRNPRYSASASKQHMLLFPKGPLLRGRGRDNRGYKTAREIERRFVVRLGE